MMCFRTTEIPPKKRKQNHAVNEARKKQRKICMNENEPVFEISEVRNVLCDRSQKIVGVGYFCYTTRS